MVADDIKILDILVRLSKDWIGILTCYTTGLVARALQDYSLSVTDVKGSQGYNNVGWVARVTRLDR
jgi:hypothetical protein